MSDRLLISECFRYVSDRASHAVVLGPDNRVRRLLVECMMGLVGHNGFPATALMTQDPAKYVSMPSIVRSVTLRAGPENGFPLLGYWGNSVFHNVPSELHCVLRTLFGNRNDPEAQERIKQISSVVEVLSGSGDHSLSAILQSPSFLKATCQNAELLPRSVRLWPEMAGRKNQVSRFLSLAVGYDAALSSEAPEILALLLMTLVATRCFSKVNPLQTSLIIAEGLSEPLWDYAVRHGFCSQARLLSEAICWIPDDPDPAFFTTVRDVFSTVILVPDREFWTSDRGLSFADQLGLPRPVREGLCVADSVDAVFVLQSDSSSWATVSP